MFERMNVPWPFDVPTDRMSISDDDGMANTLLSISEMFSIVRVWLAPRFTFPSVKPSDRVTVALLATTVLAMIVVLSFK